VCTAIDLASWLRLDVHEVWGDHVMRILGIALEGAHAWKMLPAVALALFALSAGAQEKPEWQKRLDQMNLPIDPKFTSLLNRTNDRQNRCFTDAATRLFATIQKDADVIERACKACDKEISAYGKVWFDASREQYPDRTIEQSIQSQKDFCRTWSSLRVSELRGIYNGEIVERVPYGSFGDWRTEGQLARDGLLSYALIGRGVPELSIEIICIPARDHLVEYIRGPFVKSPGEKEVYVTYIADAGSMKQSVGYIDEGEVIVPGRDDTADLMAMAHRADIALRLSVQGHSATFAMAGYQSALLEWGNRCFKK
jgi:hypothetical protein